MFTIDASARPARIVAALDVTRDGALFVIERDNRIGAAAELKRIYRVELDGLATATLGDRHPPTLVKTLVRDLLPDLASGGGQVVDKVEGMTIDAAGEVFVVSDNDGVDDSDGETRFLRLGPVGELGGEDTASR